MFKFEEIMILIRKYLNLRIKEVENLFFYYLDN